MGKNLRVMTKARLMLADITDTEIKSIQTDRGEVFLVDADEPVVDAEVFVVDNDGIRTMPDDGDYMYENLRITVTNGVITAIADESAQPQELEDEPGEKKGRVGKLKLEASLPEITEKLNEVIEAVNEISDAVDEVGGNTEQVPMIEELSQKVKSLEPVISKTVETLSEISKRSNGSFEHPNPDPPENKKTKVLTTQAVIDHFKK